MIKEQMNQLLEYTLSEGVDQAEVCASKTSGFSVSIRNHKKEQQERHQNQDYELNVYKDNKSASVNSSDFSNQGLINAAKKCASLVHLSEPDSGIELAPKELMAKNIKQIKSYFASEIDLNQAFDIALRAERGMLSTKDNIRSDSTSFSTIKSKEYYLNSHGFDESTKSTQYSISANAIAEKDGSMEIGSQYDIKLDFNDLRVAEKIGTEAAKKALRKLEGRKIKTTNAPVIFSFEVSSSLIQHLLTALSGGSQYHQQSFFLNQLGKKILPSTIDIFEDPFIEKSLYSRAVDAEGLAKKEQFFIKQGIVKNYLLDHHSATKLKMKHTANAGGISNTIASQKNAPSFGSLVETMHCGLIVTDLMGSSINPVTGDYSRGASGFWVENGIIQYPVKEITIAGNLKNIYQNIVSIARDFDERKSIRVGSILIEQMTIAGN